VNETFVHPKPSLKSPGGLPVKRTFLRLQEFAADDRRALRSRFAASPGHADRLRVILSLSKDAAVREHSQSGAPDERNAADV
jgi:hypothetical protein